MLFTNSFLWCIEIDDYEVMINEAFVYSAKRRSSPHRWSPPHNMQFNGSSRTSRIFSYIFVILLENVTMSNIKIWLRNFLSEGFPNAMAWAHHSGHPFHDSTLIQILGLLDSLQFQCCFLCWPVYPRNFVASVRTLPAMRAEEQPASAGQDTTLLRRVIWASNPSFNDSNFLPENN